MRELHASEGVSVLLSEQNAAAALALADTAYVLENGRVVSSGSAAEMRARADVQELYLGTRERTAVASLATT